MNTTIKIRTESYNAKRCGRPWIAKVVKGEFQFGNWNGSYGSSGILSIECSPGDVIAMGQKDNRQPKNSKPEYALVMEVRDEMVKEIDCDYSTGIFLQGNGKFETLDRSQAMTKSNA